MNTSSTPFLIGIAVVALVIGAVGGYFYANPQSSYDAGFILGKIEGRKELELELTAKAEVTKRAQESLAAQAANPFAGNESNPLENVTTNPFEKVKVNPFAQ